MRICETCGSPGWEGLLVACSKCHVAYEHCYCMRENSFDTSTDFVCADCSTSHASKNVASVSTKVVPRSRLKNKVRVESTNPVPRWKTIPESSKMKLISPEEVRKLSCGGEGSKSPFKVPRPVPVHCATGLTKRPVCLPRTKILNSAPVVARKTNPMVSPPKKPPTSPHSFQIRPGLVRQASKTQAVAEGSKAKVIDGAKYDGSKDICQSIVSQRLLQLLPYRPALNPTWNGRIAHSATPSEFNGEFLAQPASKIRGNAYRLSKAIPVLLKVELVPIGTLLNDLFVNRNPGLSDVEMYIFPDEKNTKRVNKEEYAYLTEAMKSRNAMIKINIEDTPLLIFSSKLLDEPSQIFIKMQKKTNNFLWGIFLVKEKSVALLPGTSSQTAQRSDDGDVIDKDTQPKFRLLSDMNRGKQVQRQ